MFIKIDDITINIYDISKVEKKESHIIRTKEKVIVFYVHYISDSESDLFKGEDKYNYLMSHLII